LSEDATLCESTHIRDYLVKWLLSVFKNLFQLLHILLRL